MRKRYNEMNRYHSWITTITVLILDASLPVATGYTLMTGKLSWNDAISKCHLASPDIQFRKGDKVGTWLNITNDVIKGDTWVGYIKAFTTFTYIGCWETSSLKDYTNKSLSTRLDVGECHSVCSTEDPYFAITHKANSEDNNCRCLRDIPSPSEWPQCNKKCHKLICGRDQGTYTSVYTRANNVNDGTITDDHAVCFTTDVNGTEESRECDDDKGIVGINCTTHSWQRDQKSYSLIVNQEKYEWFDIVQNCPVAGDGGGTSSNDGIYWKTMIGTMSIYSVAETEPDHSLFGYVTKDLKLKFSDDSDAEYNVLCDDRSTTTPGTTTISTTTSDATGPDKPTSTTGGITDISDNTSASTESSSVNGKTSTDESTDNNELYLYIGIGVGLSLMFVTVIISVMFWLRFRKKETKSEANASATEFQNNVYNGEPSDETARPIDDNTYAMPCFPDDHGASESDRIPAYHILERVPAGKKPGTSDNTYDVCGRDNDRQNNQTDNVYNIAGHGHVIDDVYDHAGNNGHKFNTGKIENYDVYDHAGNGRETGGTRADPHSDECYDVCDHVTTSATNKKEDSDTYNHI